LDLHQGIETAMHALFAGVGPDLFAVTLSQLIERLFNNMTAVTMFLGDLTYAGLIICALWGTYFVVATYRRVKSSKFRNEEVQNKFLMEVEQAIARGDFSGAMSLCEGDRRVLAQLTLLALSQRDLGHAKVRQMVVDRFQRDFLSDLDYRLSWIQMCIKSAPMLGLLGTVLGMMAAFAKLAAGQGVQASTLASDISLALITTMMGLSIAIPLVVAVADINVRIRKFEDGVGAGLARFFDAFKGGAAKR
jgi:biopolymer transport protein ExbB/TolQ